MKKGLIKLLGAIVIATTIGIIALLLIGIFGGLKITDGCLLRYNNDYSTTTDTITNTVILKGSSNYTLLNNASSGSSNPNYNLNPGHYGEWLNTNLSVSSGQQITIKAQGEVSLCQAYIPSNNLQSTSNLDKNSNQIPIPRVDDSSSNPVSLIFNATTNGWRNIAQLNQNDKIIVSISPDSKPTYDSNGNIISDVNAVLQYDVFNKNNVQADCRQGKQSYSPICGRYSVYSGNYISSCSWGNTCTSNYTCSASGHYNYSTFSCDSSSCCPSGSFNCSCGASYYNSGSCSDPSCSYSAYTSCGTTSTSSAPAVYQYNGSVTMPASGNPTSFMNLSPDYSTQSSCNAISASNYKNWWFSANNNAAATYATGLYYRLNSNLTPTDSTATGTFIQYNSDQSAYNNNSNYQIIYNITNSATSTQYLQYRFLNTGNAANNTGGYVLNVKQSKCRRLNGVGITDTYNNRGQILYLITKDNPNTSGNTYQTNSIVVDVDGNGNIQVPNNSSGYLWMKIDNAQNDYQNSIGQYSVQFFTSQSTGRFVNLVLTPFFNAVSSMINTAGQTLFQNMTCYNFTDKSSCTNFFNYIKAILILYVAVYGGMFLMGVTQISQTDLVIRVIKIGIVAGLMNQNTFNFFNTYVFNFVTGFTAEIIANMSGYSLFTSSGTIPNPFMSLDSLMSRIFFSKTFLSQLLALLATGISGIIYFVIVIVALVIVIITSLRAIATYVMAILALALLIGLAPIFLTFMLFDFTRYLFDNWVRFTFRYMMEPVILMAGIIVLTQMFTIYLDYAVGYSVCWKCALPIKIPFPNIPGFTPAFANVPLFCINWFAPWGFDYRSGMMGINMQHIIALVMISYCMYGYTQLSNSLVARLVQGGPSATSMGMQMTSNVGQKVLGRFGLDRGSRDNIQKSAQARLRQRTDDTKMRQAKEGAEASKRKGPKNEKESS